MSKLVWTNLSFDGIRDVKAGTSGSGAVSWHEAYHRTRTPGAQSGKPYHSGVIPAFTDNAYNAKGTATGPVGSQTVTPTNTDPASMRDFANTACITTAAARTTSVSYSSFKGSSTATRSWYGWGTAGGWQAATNGEISSASGSLKDGTSTYTTAAWPLSSSNSQPSGSNWDGNKWLSGVITSSYTPGINPTVYSTYLIFEGAGANTTDTDWSNFFWTKGVAGGIGAYILNIGGTNYPQPASFTPNAYNFQRTNSNFNLSSTATTTYSRVRVAWNYGAQVASGTTNGSKSYISFT